MASSYGLATGQRSSRTRDLAQREKTPTLTAGVALNAAEALEHQQTFTRAQVAYLMHLAYESGRTSSHREDLAELTCVWNDRLEPRRTYEQRVADRRGEMTAGGERERRRPKRSSVNVAYDWPAVTKPGSLSSVDVLMLAQRLAHCPCERRSKRHFWDGLHRTPGNFPAPAARLDYARSAA